MTNNTIEALRRADRALVRACLLVALSVGVAVLIQNVTSVEGVAFAVQRALLPAPHVDVAENHTAQKVTPKLISGVAQPAATNVSYELPAVVPTPRAAAELTLIRVLEDQRCLAEAMYYEARGEGREGQEAVAEVIFDRMKSRSYPHTICGVVYQGASLGGGCQFSFACNGQLNQPKIYGAWARARLLAAKIMAGVVQIGALTGGAISFHAVDVQPDWADGLEETTQIGNHVFYRVAPRDKAS